MKTPRERISLLINDMSMNQKEFAKMVGLDTAILCRILKGQFNPSISSIIKIADTTGVDCNWLLGFGPDTPIERMD